MNPSENPAATIAALNDQFRRSLGFQNSIPGQLVTTAGVAALPPDTQAQIFREVRAFNAFTEDNDPHAEHDFGAIAVPGVGKVFWKIDYYTPDYRFGSENPADLGQTARVLTIMLSEEY